MALLTNNRNKLPEIEGAAPVSGTTPGVRGDWTISPAGGSVEFYVCTVSSVSRTDATNSVWTTKNFDPTPV